MDNINVIRVGFSIPEFKISDTDGEIDNPVDRSGKGFTCLLFINADEHGAAIIKDLESGLPNTASGFKVMISAIVPDKLKSAKTFKNNTGFETRLFCDSDLRIGKLFSIIDSGQARPSYHPAVFIIGEDGSIRYRHSIGPEKLNIQLLRNSIGNLT